MVAEGREGREGSLSFLGCLMVVRAPVEDEADHLHRGVLPQQQLPDLLVLDPSSDFGGCLRF